MGWRRFVSTSFVEDAMMKATESQFIESTAGQVAAELARRGIAPDQHVTVVVEPDDWIAEARRFSRQKVIEAGWSDDDIDRLIKQAQQEVEHLLPEGDSLSIPTFLSVRH
jgi:hypothetical protein